MGRVGRRTDDVEGDAGEASGMRDGVVAGSGDADTPLLDAEVGDATATGGDGDRAGTSLGEAHSTEGTCWFVVVSAAT